MMCMLEEMGCSIGVARLSDLTGRFFRRQIWIIYNTLNQENLLGV